MNKNLIPISIIIAGIIIAGAFIFINQEGKLSADIVAEQTIKYINENLLEEGFTASLVEISDAGNVYKIRLEIGEQEHESFVSKDGKFLFPTGIDMERGISAPQPVEQGEGGDEAKVFSGEQLETLAKCLSEKGVKFYGTHWCGFCTRQKEMFGEAAQYLPYIECDQERATEQEFAKCQEAGVGPVPDWRFPDGRQETGMLPLEKLAELSGCQI